MAYVYRHIRDDKNEVFYIGIGLTNSYKRAKTTVSRNGHWKKIVALTSWYSEILFDNISVENAKLKEIEFINLYGRSDLGNGTLCNLTHGGDATLGYVVNKETKKRLSDINKGKKLSIEHRNKISNSHKGKVFTEEWLLKMRNAKLGKKQTEETINKRRLKLIGNKSNTGKKLSEEQRNKMKESQQLRRIREKTANNDTERISTNGSILH